MRGRGFAQWAACMAMAVGMAWGWDVPDMQQRMSALGDTSRIDATLRAALLDDGAFGPMDAPGPDDWLANHPEPGQTFEQYRASWPNRPDETRRSIVILPLDIFPPKGAPSLDFLRRFAEAYFGLPVRLLPPAALQGQHITQRVNPYTHGRQLLTRDLLGFLGRGLPPDAFCLLGITIQDLYPDPNWNFVFGQASLTGRVGVYSFARYAPAFYGQKEPDPERLILLRSCKVLAHETGHMFGLQHCIYYRCLMNGTNHLGETDSRPMALCPVCLRKLQWAVGFDVVRRYSRLRDLCREAGFQEEARWLSARLNRLQGSRPASR